jgi:predicted RNase H-like HicB family nuclease
LGFVQCLLIVGFSVVKALLDYQVVCRRDENGSFVACVPAIESCHAIGATPEQAQQELESVFDLITEEFAECGKPLPDDVQLGLAHTR